MPNNITRHLGKIINHTRTRRVKRWISKNQKTPFFYTAFILSSLAASSQVIATYLASPALEVMNWTAAILLLASNASNMMYSIFKQLQVKRVYQSHVNTNSALKELADPNMNTFRLNRFSSDLAIHISISVFGLIAAMTSSAISLFLPNDILWIKILLILLSSGISIALPPISHSILAKELKNEIKTVANENQALERNKRNLEIEQKILDKTKEKDQIIGEQKCIIDTLNADKKALRNELNNSTKAQDELNMQIQKLVSKVQRLEGEAELIAKQRQDLETKLANKIERLEINSDTLINRYQKHHSLFPPEYKTITIEDTTEQESKNQGTPKV